MLHVEVEFGLPSDDDLRQMLAGYINPLATDPVFLDIHYHFHRTAFAMTSPGDDVLFFEYWSVRAGEYPVPTFTVFGLDKIMEALRVRVSNGLTPRGRPLCGT